MTQMEMESFVIRVSAETIKNKVQTSLIEKSKTQFHLQVEAWVEIIELLKELHKNFVWNFNTIQLETCNIFTISKFLFLFVGSILYSGLCL